VSSKQGALLQDHKHTYIPDFAFTRSKKLVASRKIYPILGTGGVAKAHKKKDKMEGRACM